jgi:hypothetical protein
MLAPLLHHFGAGWGDFLPMRFQTLNDPTFSRFDARAECFDILRTGLPHRMASEPSPPSPFPRTARRLRGRYRLILPGWSG